MPSKLPKQIYSSNRKKAYRSQLILATVAVTSISLSGIALGLFIFNRISQTSITCESLNLAINNSLLLNTLSSNCYKFNAQQGQILIIDTNFQVSLTTPNKQNLSLRGQHQIPVDSSGEYTLELESNSATSIKVELQQASQKSKLDLNYNIGLSQSQPYGKSVPNLPPKISYNVKIEPTFIIDRQGKMRHIKEEAIALISNKGLPIGKFSMSLINLEEPCCVYVGYQDELPRFPASITKLFWMVATFARYQGTDITPIQDKVDKMIQNSDNNPASSILDELTGTNSGKPFPSGTIEAWIAKRKSVNKVFTDAGYPDLNISQKNFPIPDLDLREPEGRDLQMRGDPQSPERNYLTTYSVARLLLEIEQGKAVSPLSSEKMKSLLKRDYIREKNREYDAIKGFFGEGLDPEKIHLYSKAGWTNESRQDAAIVISRDGKTKYILVVFGNDASFAKDETIFPDIAKMVYTKLRL
jgi:hypothetical protein